jgi:hypothetical protein
MKNLKVLTGRQLHWLSIWRPFCLTRIALPVFPGSLIDFRKMACIKILVIFLKKAETDFRIYGMKEVMLAC